MLFTSDAAVKVTHVERNTTFECSTGLSEYHQNILVTLWSGACLVHCGYNHKTCDSWNVEWSHANMTCVVTITNTTTTNEPYHCAVTDLTTDRGVSNTSASAVRPTKPTKEWIVIIGCVVIGVLTIVIFSSILTCIAHKMYVRWRAREQHNDYVDPEQRPLRQYYNGTIYAFIIICNNDYNHNWGSPDLVCLPVTLAVYVAHSYNSPVSFTHCLQMALFV